MVNSALRILALHMCFNGTGIWGGETMCIKGYYIIIFLLLNANKTYLFCDYLFSYSRCNKLSCKIVNKIYIIHD